jgi:pimeloyl-ACP methyl ester carboxylesterase
LPATAGYDGTIDSRNGQQPQSHQNRHAIFLDPVAVQHQAELMSPSLVHLVQIPALGCDHRLYKMIAIAISSSFKIQSIIPMADRYEAMVAEVLKRAPDHFVIMGTSMGGRLALETALAAPDRVQGLIIIGAGPGAVADPSAGLKRSARIRAGELEEVVTEMSEMIAHMPSPNGKATVAAFKSMARAIGPEITANQSDALAHRVDRWNDLQRITCPTLLLWGQEDKFSPAADALKMHAAIPGSRCAVIPKCGHFPTLENPDQASAIILQWLQDSRLK